MLEASWTFCTLKDAIRGAVPCLLPTALRSLTSGKGQQPRSTPDRTRGDVSATHGPLPWPFTWTMLALLVGMMQSCLQKPE